MADRQKQRNLVAICTWAARGAVRAGRPPACATGHRERRCSRRVKNAHVPVPLYYCPPVGQPCSSIREAKGRKPTHEEERRGWRLRPPGGRARRSSSLAAPARPAGLLELRPASSSRALTLPCFPPTQIKSPPPPFLVPPSWMPAGPNLFFFFKKKLLHVFCNLSFKALKKQQEHSFK
jgi:hypothetical protein